MTVYNFSTSVHNTTQNSSGNLFSYLQTTIIYILCSWCVSDVSVANGPLSQINLIIAQMLSIEGKGAA